MQDEDWNIVLEEGGPIISQYGEDILFPVQKGGKAVMKGLVMNAENVSSDSDTGIVLYVAAYYSR